MIDFYSERMSGLVGFAVRNFNMSLPKDTTFEDLKHEVSVALFLSGGDRSTTNIVNQARWCRYGMWKDHLSRAKGSVPRSANYSDSLDAIDAKEIIKKIIALKDLSKQERNFLILRLEGLDPAEIKIRMKLKNRQRFEQIKKSAYFKVRVLYPTGAYWRADE